MFFVARLAEMETILNKLTACAQKVQNAQEAVFVPYIGTSAIHSNLTR